MGTYYVDNDVGPTGGTGTQADPYGIETAIAAAQPGDVFYWRGGGEGDVTVGHTLNFNRGGTDTAPIHWIGTDDDWVPIPPGQTPSTGVDGSNAAYTVVEISASHQILENVRIHNTLQGRYGGVIGCLTSAVRALLRNCVVHDSGTGFSSTALKGHLFLQCQAYDVGYGFDLGGLATWCGGCVVYDTESHAFRLSGGGVVSRCRAHALGGNGVEFYRDAAAYPVPLTVDRFSVYDCADGVRINAYNGINANVFTIINSLFDTCSGYAVNVTTPAGQLGVILNNGSHNCTNGQVPTGRPGLINENWITLSAGPFVDPQNGDLGLKRDAPVIGAATDGGDLGALQRRFVRLPYPVVY